MALSLETEDKITQVKENLDTAEWNIMLRKKGLFVSVYVFEGGKQGWYDVCHGERV